MPKALIEIVGNAESFVRSLKQSTHSVSTFKTELRELNVDVKRSAEVQVKASAARIGRIREEMGQVKALAATYVRGSDEQIAAMELVARKQRELSRLTGIGGLTGTGVGRGGRASRRREEREASGLMRGGLEGLGIGHLGMAALAGGTFFGSFFAGTAIKSAIDAATEAAAVERQLAAQYKASGQSLEQYRGQINKTLDRESALSGFNKDELTKSFIGIYRASGDTGKSLDYLGIAVNLARARHMDLEKASLLVAKVVNGNVGLLKRYGIETYKGETATQALAAMQAKFAGQARAGTTAQQRFSAQLHNSEVIIGTALLPTVTHLLAEGARWLDQMNRSGRLQRDVNAAVRAGSGVFHALAAGVKMVSGAIRTVDHVTGSFKNTLKLIAGIALANKFLGWSRALGMGGLAGDALAAETKVGGLRGKLLGLSRMDIPVLTIPISIAIIGKEKAWLEKHAGILAGPGKALLDLAGGGGATGSIITDLTGIKGPKHGLLFGGGGGKSGGDVIPTDKQAQRVIAAARMLRDQGYSKARIEGQFHRWHPKWSQDAIDVLVSAAMKGQRVGRGADVGNTGTPRPDLLPLHSFALTNKLTNELAGALGPKQDKKAAEDALAYTQKLIQSGRLVGQAYTDALKERRKLYDQIARDEKKLDPKKAADPHKAAHHVTAAQRAKAARDAARAADTASAHRILGIGGRGQLTGPQATLAADERRMLENVLAQRTHMRVAVLRRKAANLTTASLIDLVKSEFGDKMPKATAESLDKINQVLKLKFIPDDVRQNIRNRLAQIRNTLTSELNATKKVTSGFHGVTSEQFVQGIPGLTRAQRIMLEERYSQVQAHGGRPTGPAVLGQPTQGGHVTHIGKVEVHGVQNLDQLINQIEKRTRHKVQRGGVRR